MKVKYYKSNHLIASKQVKSRSWAHRIVNIFVSKSNLRITSDWCAGDFRRIQGQDQSGFWHIITVRY